MEVQTYYMILYFIKWFIINFYVYYSFNKIVNLKNINIKKIIMIFLFNLVITFVCTYIKYYISSFLSSLIKYFLYGCSLGTITKNKLGYSLVITIISYAICVICLEISAIITFFLNKQINIENLFLNLFIILILQFIMIYAFFKIKRFKNGFDFLYKKLNNDYADTIILYISSAITCFLGTLPEEIDSIRKNLLMTIVVLGVIMLVVIQKTLTMYYKQTLLKKELEEYKKQIKEKESELKKISDEKFKISKVTHEFYNRQKALELLVKSNINTENYISTENTNKNVLNMIQSLTEEYSKQFNKIKNSPPLDTTGIPEIDSMFKYMQSECIENNIEFKLKIIGNIHFLINNIIPKNKLETLIGDHLRDAIRAVNSINNENKQIFVILGINDNKYELAIYDTGIEFKIDTLLKLGQESVTTYSNKGGTGIGFLTTFETMKQTKASLIITELVKNNSNYFTKSVTIRFDDKNEYKICSYRADEIKKYNNNKQILIEKI